MNHRIGGSGVFKTFDWAQARRIGRVGLRRDRARRDEVAAGGRPDGHLSLIAALAIHVHGEWLSALARDVTLGVR